MKRIKTFLAVLMIAAVTFTSFPALYGNFSVYAASVKKPAQVRNLKAKVKGSNYISLKWNKVKTKGTKGYMIYRYNASTKKWKKIKKITSVKTITFTVKKLKANTKYKFRVRAYTTYKRKGKTKYRYGKYSAVLSSKTKKKSTNYSKKSVSVKKVSGAVTGTNANPAPSTPMLVSNVTMWTYDTEKKKWKKNKTYDYTYNEHGDPATVKYDWVYYRGQSNTTYSYKYRSDGTRKSATYKESSVDWNGLGGEWITGTANGIVSYDKNGRVTTKKVSYSGTYDSGQSAGKGTSTYKWEHLIGGLYKDATASLDESFIVTAQNNGIIKRIQRKWLDDPWRTYYTYYENGLPKKKTYHDDYYIKYTSTYDKETGLLKSIKMSQQYEGNTSVSRVDFTYDTIACSRERYICMINSFVMSENDLSFLWY